MSTDLVADHFATTTQATIDSRAVILELNAAACRKEKICSNEDEESVSTSSEDDGIVQDEDVEE